MRKEDYSSEFLGELEKRLGYRFQDRELLVRALTHSSYAHEQAGEPIRDNERLEFLGDAVLGLVVCDIVFHMSGEDEGRLTRLKSHLVSARTGRRLAEDLRLGRYIRLGKGEEQDGGRHKPSLLANAFESVVGAVYLDGGLEAARALILSAYEPVMLYSDFEELIKEDFKSRLQEKLQSHKLPPPEYSVVEETGPAHRKRFTVEIRIGGGEPTRGTGGSKKSAEQAAAAAALELIDSGGLDLATLSGE